MYLSPSIFDSPYDEGFPLLKEFLNKLKYSDGLVLVEKKKLENRKIN